MFFKPIQIDSIKMMPSLAPKFPNKIWTSRELNKRQIFSLGFFKKFRMKFELKFKEPIRAAAPIVLCAVVAVVELCQASGCALNLHARAAVYPGLITFVRIHRYDVGDLPQATFALDQDASSGLVCSKKSS
jgi:hypothetical protein